MWPPISTLHTNTLYEIMIIFTNLGCCNFMLNLLSPDCAVAVLVSTPAASSIAPHSTACRPLSTLPSVSQRSWLPSLLLRPHGSPVDASARGVVFHPALAPFPVGNIELLGSPYYKGVPLPRIPSVRKPGMKSRIAQRSEHASVT